MLCISMHFKITSLLSFFHCKFWYSIPVCGCIPSRFSCVWLFATLWTVVCQAPLFIGFSRQEYWSGLPCPPPGDLPDPGIKPMSLVSPALASRFFTTSATGEAQGTPSRTYWINKVTFGPILKLNGQNVIKWH